MTGAESVALHVQQRATAFASGDAGVRRRGLARAVAVQEQQLVDLAALLAATVASRGPKAARDVDRLLNSASSRYRNLMEQLRIESSATQRVTMIAQGSIAVTAEAGA